MIDGILDWITNHQTLTFWMMGLSVVVFVGSLVSLPFLVSRIPEDYFSDARQHRGRFERLHPLAHLGLRLLRNLLGWLFVLAGLLMLVLPGQGLLTILMGLILCDFPGKYRLERRLVAAPGVFRAINWLRRRAGHPPLLAPKTHENP